METACIRGDFKRHELNEKSGLFLIASQHETYEQIKIILETRVLHDRMHMWDYERHKTS